MPQLNFYQVGVAFVAFVVFGTLAFWAWVAIARAIRERRDEFEPKQDPPAWRTFALKEDVEREFKELRTEIKEMKAESGESRRILYEKIRGLGEGVASLESKTEMLCRQNTQMDNKLDRLIERIAHHE